MLNFIINHLNELWIVISSAITGASAITALTPTQKDDNILAQFKKTVKSLKYQSFFTFEMLFQIVFFFFVCKVYKRINSIFF